MKRNISSFIARNPYIPLQRNVMSTPNPLCVGIGGPGITHSDLLIINMTDLAPHVGANLEIMAADAKKQRGDRSFIFTNLRQGEGVEEVVAVIRKQGLHDEMRH
jgi:urease accessory protein UreG